MGALPDYQWRSQATIRAWALSVHRRLPWLCRLLCPWITQWWPDKYTSRLSCLGPFACLLIIISQMIISYVSAYMFIFYEIVLSYGLNEQHVWIRVMDDELFVSFIKTVVRHLVFVLFLQILLINHRFMVLSFFRLLPIFTSFLQHLKLYIQCS